MADNVSVTAGSGTSIATDDVAGVHFQRVKLDIGGDGVTSPITSGNPLPVSGTFWQATQPVSGTVTANAGTGSFTVAQATAANLNATVVGTGTFAVQAAQSGTWNIGSITTLPALATGSNVIGALVANQSVNSTQIGGVAIATGSGVVGTGVQRVVLATDVALPAGTNTIGTTTGPTLTKGTQGATGYSTQDLKDAGRVIFSAATVIAGVTAVTAEALLSMVATRDGVAAAGATTFAVTAGKRLRITRITVGFISTAAAVLSMRFALRMNPSGAVTATSPILQIFPLSSGAALAQAGNEMTIEIPDGIEFSGTHQFGITQIGSAATGTCWVSVAGFEY